MRWKRNSIRAVMLGILAIASICGPKSVADDAVLNEPGVGAPDADDTPRFALLIGVARYPRLDPGDQLSGSVNDVEALRKLLVERLRFRPEHVRTLVNAEATGEGIREALSELAETLARQATTKSPAQVWVHFSGHGSQVADQAEGPDHDEDDGLDETWVPSDATRQGGDQDIRDDEVHRWVGRLSQANRARILITADCCHSGTGARGATRIRQLRREVVPASQSTVCPVLRKRLPDGVVFLSACRDREVEPEFQDGETTYGLMTRFLVEALSADRVLSRMSYERLRQSIIAHYQRDGRVLEMRIPQLEGSAGALGSIVMGLGPQADLPPYFEVAPLEGSSRVSLRAGVFQRVTVGSLLELYERPETLDTTSSLAWLRVIQVDGATSTAEVFRWKDRSWEMAEDYQLPPTFRRGVAVARQLAPGDPSLRLRVVRVESRERDSDPLAPGDRRFPPSLARVLETSQVPGESAWLKWSAESDPGCDLVLRIDGDFAALFPATGVAQVDEEAAEAAGRLPNSLRGGWHPVSLGSETDMGDDGAARRAAPLATLPEALRQIARVRNLLGLARTQAARTNAGYDVGVELLQIKTAAEGGAGGGETSTSPWQTGPDGLITMRAGQRFAWRVSNRATNGKPIYVTLLEISPRYGIQVVMPYEEPPIRLGPGEERESDMFDCASPHGERQLVLLATREECDFRGLAEDHLDVSRGTALGGGAAELSQLLADVAEFRPATSRGPRRRSAQSANTWFSQVITWSTIP
jgi:hypothetical protein